MLQLLYTSPGALGMSFSRYFHNAHAPGRI